MVLKAPALTMIAMDCQTTCSMIAEKSENIYTDNDALYFARAEAVIE